MDRTICIEMYKYKRHRNKRVKRHRNILRLKHHIVKKLFKIDS
jgi:hypothetical protein